MKHLLSEFLNQELINKLLRICDAIEMQIWLIMTTVNKTSLLN